MKKLTCAIIDDEKLAADLLASYAEKTPFLDLVGTYYSAIDAIKTLTQTPVDILFLDIEMPELNGIEFAKVLPPTTKVVFTTAYKQYTLDTFQVNAAGYLLKPISYESFVKAAEKVMKYTPEDSLQTSKAIIADRMLLIKSEYKLLRVSLDDILYIHGLKDYVKIHIKGGTPVTSLLNLSKLQQALPASEFMRVHRSYIVHMTKIDMIDRMRFVFGNEYIPVSDSYKDDVLHFIDAHTL